jgi:hypothetical protein
MLPISAQELSQARSDIAELLSMTGTTAAIQARTRTRDEEGGWTEIWATSATAPCEVGQNSLQPHERLIAEQNQTLDSWVIVLPAGTPVAVGNRVIVTGPDWPNQEYEPYWCPIPESWELDRRILAVRHAQ